MRQSKVFWISPSLTFNQQKNIYTTSKLGGTELSWFHDGPLQGFYLYFPNLIKSNI